MHGIAIDNNRFCEDDGLIGVSLSELQIKASLCSLSVCLYVHDYIYRIIHITLQIIQLLKQSFTHECVLAGAKVIQFCRCGYHGHIALCLQRSCCNLRINNTKHTHSMLMEAIHFHARKPHKHNCIIEEYCYCIIIPYNNTNFILCIPFLYYSGWADYA